MMFDISLKESTLTEEDKKNPALKRLFATGLALQHFLTPSIYDLLSLPAAMDDISPKIQQFIKYEESMLESFGESINIHEAIKAPAITSPKEQEARQVKGKDQLQIGPAQGTK
jgi:hypothetical protein